MCSKELKMHLLDLILKNKSVLFGAFSNKITKQDKSETWKKIHEEAVASGVFQNKPWGYIRDAFWPNIKKSAMFKVDNARRTGSEGGKKCILTEIDQKVLEILSKDAPDVIGLPVTESMEVSKQNPTENVETVVEQSVEDDDSQQQKENRTPRRQMFSCTETKRKQPKFDNENIYRLREEKLLLEIAGLKKDNIKKDLETQNLKLKNQLLEKLVSDGCGKQDNLQKLFELT
ncbi:uncharacterized protein LOC129911998 [Episyrphus balteatus]|uniref:uncharacterized protein LOC129911998 n=1 Tax=Episyrphus balteatus TaxID=286459 RepID=UPI0024867A4D|nr:uncharacterized protein LOC129911998 [Episyrphus balteatus]